MYNPKFKPIHKLLIIMNNKKIIKPNIANKQDLDQYFTKEFIAKNLIKKTIKVLKKYLNLEKMIWIEPSAGTGSFFHNLPSNKIGIDLYPKSSDIKKDDYLNFQLPLTDYIIIGNPPFGRNASLAKKFIKKSKHAKAIAFVLPKSFKKTSFKITFNRYFHLKYEEDMPFNAFTFNNKDYNVPCIFQIWIKLNTKNHINNAIAKTKLVKFVNNQQDSDFVIRRVGYYAGKIYKNALIEQKNKNSHYFVKTSLDHNFFYQEYIKKIFFEHDNTVGPRSISKKELVDKLNAAFKG